MNVVLSLKLNVNEARVPDPFSPQAVLISVSTPVTPAILMGSVSVMVPAPPPAAPRVREVIVADRSDVEGDSAEDHRGAGREGRVQFLKMPIGDARQIYRREEVGVGMSGRGCSEGEQEGEGRTKTVHRLNLVWSYITRRNGGE